MVQGYIVRYGSILISLSRNTPEELEHRHRLCHGTDFNGCRGDCMTEAVAWD